MTRRVQDWISGYVDALLRERSAGAIAREARSEDEALLVKAARRLKYQAVKDELEPRPEFVASLERELRKELAKASPKVQGIPFWRQSWARTLGGVAAAAAIIMVVVWSRAGSAVPTAPTASQAPAVAPAAAPDKQEATAPAPGPAMRASGAAPAAPAAPPSPPPRNLAQAVAEAQTILLGQVVDVSVAPPGELGKGAPGPSNVRVTISVERYLKGPLPDNQVTLRATPGAAQGEAFSKGERVLVMARNTGGDGVLEAVAYPRTRDSVTMAEPAPAGAADTKRREGQGNLTLDELVSRVEGLLGGKP